MPIKQVDRWTEWITLNLVNGVYLIKDWIILNVGAGLTGTVINDREGMVDELLKWGIGLSILVFNIVRIVKYISDIKRNKETKDSPQ